MAIFINFVLEECFNLCLMYNKFKVFGNTEKYSASVSSYINTALRANDHSTFTNVALCIHLPYIVLNIEYEPGRR